MSLVFQNFDPPPPHCPASVYPPPLVRGEDTLAGWRKGWGVNILEDARLSFVLYICKYFVVGADSVYLDVGLSEGDHLRQYLRDMEVLHLVPLPRGLVQHVHLPHKVNMQHVHLPQGQYAARAPGTRPMRSTCTWHKVNVQHVHLPQGQYAARSPGTRSMCSTCTWHKVSVQHVHLAQGQCAARATGTRSMCSTCTWHKVNVQHVHLAQGQCSARALGTRSMCSTCTWHKVNVQHVHLAQGQCAARAPGTR
jgi:hypothetical protein